MSRFKSGRAGNALLEFTLVGIPFIFVLITTFEISRGMWIYHTMAYAVKEGTRYASVHGKTCESAPNSCTVTIGGIASQIQAHGAALMPSGLSLTFTSDAGSINCVLSDCLTSTTQWPPTGVNGTGQEIRIAGAYQFVSALVMFWTGAGPGFSLPAFSFPAASRETIQF
jgi:Flp pilus assembly protein TadG